MVVCRIQELDKFTSVSSIFKVEWKPLIIGRHTVTINFDDKKMENNYLFVDVLDLSSVKVIGLRTEDFVGIKQIFNCKSY